VLELEALLILFSSPFARIGYVELKDEALVQKAIGFSGTPLFGIPLLVQLTEAARNRGQGASSADTPLRPNLPALTAEQLASLPKINGQPIHIDPANLTGSNPATRLYVGSLHFNLTEEDIKAVFEPFGAILSVDLHREPGTLKSKGFCFIQFASGTDAEKAIQHMNGFELAGRQIKVGHVASRGSGTAANNSSSVGGNGADSNNAGLDTSGAGATISTSFDEGGGGESS
jgi:RNA-binding protein 39